MKNNTRTFFIVFIIVLIVVVAGGVGYLILKNTDTDVFQIKESKKDTLADLQSFHEKYSNGQLAEDPDNNEPLQKKLYVPEKQATTQELYEEADELFFGEGDQDHVDDAHNHMILLDLKKRFDELSPAQQKKIENLLKKPDNPESYFYPKKHHFKNIYPNATVHSLQDDIFSWLKKPFEAQHAHACYSGDYEVDCLGNTTHGKIYSVSVDDLTIHFPRLLDEDDPEGNAMLEEFMLDMALDAMGYAETSYVAFRDFFGIQDSQINRPINIWLVGDIIDNSNEGDEAESQHLGGFHLGCDQMYVDVFQSDFKSTVAHELFHCFQDSLNMLDPTYEKWMIEGGASFSEHIAFPQDNTEHQRFERYLSLPSISLFDKSYPAALFWLSESIRDSVGYVSTVMKTYGGAKDRATYVTLLKGKFHEIAEDLSAHQPTYDNSSAQIPLDSGVPIDVSKSEDAWQKINLDSFTSQDMLFALDPMSVHYFQVKLGSAVQQEGNYVRFNLGQHVDPSDADFKITATIVANNTVKKDIQLKQNDIGDAYFTICLKENEICTQDGETDTYEGATEIFLTITNTAVEEVFYGYGEVSAFGPATYLLSEVHFFGGDLAVPVRGSFEVDIDIDNQNEDERLIKTEAKRFWMAFPHQFYDWEEIPAPESPNVQLEIHPTRFTSYVNKACQFRGWIEYEINGAVIEEDLDSGWRRMTLPLKEKDKNNFYVVDQKFLCEITDELKLLIRDPASAATMAQFLAAINAAEYPENSFAKSLRNVFARLMSFDLRNGQQAKEEGDAVMDFYSPNPSVEYLRVTYANEHIKAYFVKEQ